VVGPRVSSAALANIQYPSPIQANGSHPYSGPTALKPSMGAASAFTLTNSCSNSVLGMGRLCRKPCDSSQPARAR